MNVKKKVTSIVAPVVTFLLIFAIWEIACRCLLYTSDAADE